MITVTLQIGNSDNKLTQQEWASFVNETHKGILAFGGKIHFSAPSIGWADWQNAAWIFVVEEGKLDQLRHWIKLTRQEYKQDSAAWTEGETKFI